MLLDLMARSGEGRRGGDSEGGAGREEEGGREETLTSGAQLARESLYASPFISCVLFVTP
jgi:hypothetical protein